MKQPDKLPKSCQNSVNLRNLGTQYKGMDGSEYNEKFERKLQILFGAGMKVMVLRQRDLGKIKEIIV